MPNNPRGGGVSRRVDGDERTELRDTMDQLEVPNGMSLIARTAAIGRQAEELQWDLNYLLQLWSAIEGAAHQQSGAFLIYLEGSLVIRAIRDYFQPEIGEILIDTDEVFEQAKAFMGTVMPGNVNRVKRYHDDVPLFSRFQIEHQIETAFARQVTLPSGGAIVIDHTEALVAVDVNSGRSTKGSDIEETAFKTNMEAAEELARQLRLRDLGGLIVIDFIDMENQKNQREVENRLRDGLRFDRARVQMGKISRFGLMELSRQRLRPALAETSYIPCPRCTGTGHIRSTESAALHILRILEEEAMKENTGAVHVQMPVDVATFLLNEKRPDIQAIELRHKVTILLIPNIHLETPAHTITRLRHDDLNNEDVREPSYRMVDAPIEEDTKLAKGKDENAKPRQEAVIKGISPEQPAPNLPEKVTTIVPAASNLEAGIFAKIFSWFRSPPNKPVEVAPPPEPTRKPRESRNDGRRERNDGRRAGRNGIRREEERGERPERGNRNERNTEKAPREESTATTTGERQERRPRGERKERRERQKPETVTSELPAETLASEVMAVTAAATADGVPESAGGEEQGARRRGRRGGRGRGERRNEAGSDVTAAPLEVTATVQTPIEVALAVAQASEQPVIVVIPASEPAATVAETEPAPAVVESFTQVAESVASPLAPEPVVEAIPEPTPMTPQEAVSSESVAVEEIPALLVATPEPEPADLSKVLEESGLVLVQTTSAAGVVAEPESPPVKLGRPRKPKAQEAGEEATLMMVETQK
jgi:ribonuclease E